MSVTRSIRVAQTDNSFLKGDCNVDRYLSVETKQARYTKDIREKRARYTK